MDSNARSDIWLAVPLFLICLLYPLPSLALQPLDAFVASARTQNADALEARATADEQRAEADASLGKRLPGVALRGSYARNQYDVTIALPGFAPVTLLPRDQWDGTATLNVPLIDLAAFQRVASARTIAAAGALQIEAVKLAVESQVVQLYFQLVADIALIHASQQAVEVAQASLASSSSASVTLAIASPLVGLMISMTSRPCDSTNAPSM